MCLNLLGKTINAGRGGWQKDWIDFLLLRISWKITISLDNGWGKGASWTIFPFFWNSKMDWSPPSPLKFNKTWLKDESLIDLIPNGWVHSAPGNRITIAFQFAENFRNLKEVIKTWVVDKRKRDARELQLVEA